MDKKAIQEKLDELFPSKRSCRALRESPNCFPYVVSDSKGNEFFVKAVSLVRSRKEGLDEVEGLKRVRSNRVIELLDWQKVNEDVALLVFPLVNGVTLNKVSDEWTNGRLRLLALEMAEGIQEMWSKRVVHRDLKPKNIILDQDSDHFILLDLGIGYFVDRYASKNSKSRGAQNYRSPEQIESIAGSDIDISFASDHFSLGLVLYELATGKHPFLELPKDQYATVAEGICQKVLPPICEVNPKIDKDLGKIIDTLLSKEQCGRFATPEELVQTLKGGEPKILYANSQKLFFHASNGYEAFITFTTENKSLGNVPDGIVLPATVAKKTMDRFRSLGYEILLNPLTYRLPYQKVSNLSIRKKYRIPEKEFIDQTKIHSASFIDDLAYQVVMNQRDTDYVVAPCFAVENIEESGGDGQITANIQAWKSARAVFDNTGWEKPFLGGIVVSASVLRNEKATKRLLDRLWGIYDVEGYYVILENETTGSGPVVDLELLKGYKLLVEALSRKGLVIVDRADLTMFGILTRGVISVSPERSRRRFSVDSELQNPKEMKGRLSEEKRHLHYFSDSLFDFIESRPVLGILSKTGYRSDIECHCPYCKELQPFTRTAHKKNDHTLANNHFLLTISSEHKGIRDKKPTDIKDYYKEKFTKAESLGNAILSNSRPATSRKRFGEYKSVLSIIDK